MYSYRHLQIAPRNRWYSQQISTHFAGICNPTVICGFFLLFFKLLSLNQLTVIAVNVIHSDRTHLHSALFLVPASSLNRAKHLEKRWSLEVPGTSYYASQEFIMNFSNWLRLEWLKITPISRLICHTLLNYIVDFLDAWNVRRHFVSFSVRNQANSCKRVIQVWPQGGMHEFPLEMMMICTPMRLTVNGILKD